MIKEITKASFNMINIYYLVADTHTFLWYLCHTNLACVCVFMCALSGTHTNTPYIQHTPAN